MTIDTASLSSTIVKMALDASLLRHRVLANNIANNRTTGFKPGKVEFEKLLPDSLKSYNAMYPTAELKQKLNSVKPTVVTRDEPANNGEESDIHLDQEIAKMTRNVIHYQALLTGLGKRGSILKNAITGGR